MTGGRVNNWALDQERKKAQENKKRKEAELAEMEALFGKAIPAKKKGGNFGAAFVDPKAKSKKGTRSKNLINRIRMLSPVLFYVMKLSRLPDYKKILLKRKNFQFFKL